MSQKFYSIKKSFAVLSPIELRHHDFNMHRLTCANTEQTGSVGSKQKENGSRQVVRSTASEGSGKVRSFPYMQALERLYEDMHFEFTEILFINTPR